MQNFNNPQQPPPQQGGFGAPPPPPPVQPPQKKGMSTGVKVIIGLAVVAVLGGGLVIALAVGGYYYFRSSARNIASIPTGGSRAGLSESSSADDAEPPSPTAEQSAAVAGGQSAVWPQQEITWTVPQRWRRTNADSTSLMWSSPGSSDAAFLIVNISPMSASFPTDASIKAFYDAAIDRKGRGEVSDVRWVKLGGVKGYMFRENAPENPDSPERLQWLGYRTYKGQVQLVNIMLASRGKDFARHEDTLYGVLYSTQF